MSVYNGEKYLSEQIESILNQKGVDIHLFVRDDGSSDGSKDKLGAYSANSNISILESTTNLGYKNSFLKCLEYAIEDNDFDYFAFADQDDVWLEDKMIRAVNMLDSNTKKEYRLYFSSLQFVNQDLKPTDLKTYNNLNLSLAPSLVRFSLSGATFVFNNALAKEAVAKEKYKNIPDGHDSFIYRLNAALDGFTYYDKNSYILYRRHDSNVSLGGVNGFERIKKEFAKKYDKINSNFAKAMIENYADVITDEAQIIFTKFANSHFINRVSLIFDKKFRRESATINFIFWVKVLLNKI